MAQTYDIVPLGSSGDAIVLSLARSQADGVYSWFDANESRDPPGRAFLWSHGTVAGIDPPAGSTYFLPTNVLGRRTVVGSIGNGEDGQRGAIWSRGNWRATDPLTGYLHAEVSWRLPDHSLLGMSRNLAGVDESSSVVTLWRKGQRIAVSPSIANGGSGVTDVYTDGTVLGYSWFNDGTGSHHWLWRDGVRTEITNPLDYTWRSVHGFLPTGEVLGTAWADNGDFEVIAWQDGQTRTVATVPDAYTDYLHITDINNDGMFVAFSYDEPGVPTPIPLLWDGTEFVNLRETIDPSLGWNIGMASDIDDQGRILGMGWDSDDIYRGFVLTPIPAPGVLLALALAGVPAARRRLRRT